MSDADKPLAEIADGYVKLIMDDTANIAYWVALIAAWNGDTGLALFAQAVSLNLFFASQ